MAFLDSIVRFALCLLVFLTPLIGSPYSYDQFRLVKEVFVQVTIVFISAAAAVKLSLSGALRPVRHNLVRVARRPLCLPFMLLLLIGLVSLLLSVNPGHSWQSLINLFLYSLLYLLVLEFADLRTIKRLLHLALIAGAVTSVYAVFQYYGRDPLLRQLSGAMPVGRGSTAGFLDNPDVTGAYLALVFVSSLALALGNTSLSRRLFVAVMLLLILVGIIYTQTIAAIGALMAGLASWAGLLFLSERRIRKQLIATVVLISIAAGITTWINKEFKARIDRWLSNLKARNWEYVTSGRYHTWLTTIDMIRDKPLLGHGLGTFKSIYFDYFKDWQKRTGAGIYKVGYALQAHNEYLQLWAEMGLAALLALALLCFEFFRRGLKFVFGPEAEGMGPPPKKGKGRRGLPETVEERREKKIVVIGFMSAIVLVLVNALGNFIFHLAATASLVVIILGAAMALCRSGNARSNGPQESLKVAKIRGNRACGVRWPIAAAALILAAFAINYLLRPYRASVLEKWGFWAVGEIQAGRISNARHQQAVLAFAARTLERARALDPRNANVRMLLGNAYFIQGRYLDALSEYKSAAYYIPAPQAYINMGWAYAQLGRFDQAKAAFEKVLEYNPGNEGARRGLEFVDKALRSP